MSEMFKVEHKVCIASILAGVSLWALDAFIDSQLSGGVRFLESLATVIPRHELISRAFIVLGFAVFGIILARIIARQRRSEEDLEDSVRFLNTIFDSIRDPFMIIDSDFRIVKVNEAYARLKDVSVRDLVDRRCFEVTMKRESVCSECIVERTLRSGDPCCKEKETNLPDGSLAWVEIYTYPIVNEGGVVTHVIEYVRDITDRKRGEEDRRRLIRKLEVLSTTDSLTGLLNRRLLIERLSAELDRAKRYGGGLSLLFCDLDDFKEINDTYGHAAGDRVLKAVADVFTRSIRTSDAAGRYGGDEFMVVLPGTSIDGARELAERIRQTVQDIAFPMDGAMVRTSLSIGVVHSTERESSVQDLINRIDTALYASKRAGKNQVYTLL